MLSDTSGGAFAVNESTGVIEVVDGSLLDYEVNNKHNITVRVTDAAGETYDETLTISISDVPAPVLAYVSSGLLTYTENDAPLVIDGLITVIDTDDTVLQSATVAFTSGYEAGEDQLIFTDTGTLTGVWDNAAGVLTITGPDTLSAWQSALRSVSYLNTSDSPVVGARYIEFQVADDHEYSNTVPRTISVVAQNDAPVINDITMAAIA